MIFHTIITHEYPDLDAMLCCYLLREYGEAHYPGISRAKIVFCPAGRLPDSKTPQMLEEEGILAVDIGGGKLDTHPNGSIMEKEKLHLSAANLVAENLGVQEKTSLKHLLEFTRLQDSAGQSLSSRNPIDHMMALPNIIKGGLLYFRQDFTAMTDFFMRIFHALEISSKCGDSMVRKPEEGDFQAYIERDTVFLKKIFHLKFLLTCYMNERYLHKKIELCQQVPYDSYYGFASFVAATGLDTYPELKKLIIFAEQLKPSSYLLNSDSPTDQTVSLTNIINGFYHQSPDNIKQVCEPLFKILDCIVQYEKNWHDAIVEYKTEHQLFRLGKIKLVAIEAERASVVKVARWQDRADVIVFRDRIQGHISMSINRIGKLRNSDFARLAARIRIVEHIYEQTDIPLPKVESLSEIGECMGWFLHQSKKLFLHGSPKARREASLIPFDVVIEMVKTEFDRNRKLPDPFCPTDKCLQDQCPFYTIRLPNCFIHRQSLR